MLKSPCLECDLRTSDHNSDTCVNCRARIAYLNGSPPPGYPAPTAINTIHAINMEEKPKMDTPKQPPSETVGAENLPPTTQPPKTKRCANPNCKEPQPRPATEFDANKASADGLAPRCKSCRRDYQKTLNQNKKAKNRKPSTMETKDIQAPPEILPHTSVHQVHQVHPCPQSPSVPLLHPGKITFPSDYPSGTVHPSPPQSTPDSLFSDDAAAVARNIEILAEISKPLRLILDFTDHPTLLEKVTAAAKRDFRTINNQILFYIECREGQF